jgi:hypothetical protein
MKISGKEIKISTHIFQPCCTEKCAPYQRFDQIMNSKDNDIIELCSPTCDFFLEIIRLNKAKVN